MIIKEKRNAASTLLQRSSESSHQTCLTQTKGALRSTLLLLPAAELKPAADVPRVTSPAEAAKKFSQRTLVRELRSKFSFGPSESTECSVWVWSSQYLQRSRSSKLNEVLGNERESWSWDSNHGGTTTSTKNTPKLFQLFFGEVNLSLVPLMHSSPLLPLKIIAMNASFVIRRILPCVCGRWVLR